MIYETQVLGFITRLTDITFQSFIKSLTPLVSKISGDDSIYSYSEHAISIPETAGKVMASFVQMDSQADFKKALRNSLWAIGPADLSRKVTIFLISERYTIEDLQPIREMFSFDGSEGLNTNFVFCGLGKECDMKVLGEFSNKKNLLLNKFYRWKSLAEYMEDYYKKGKVGKEFNV